MPISTTTDSGDENRSNSVDEYRRNSMHEKMAQANQIPVSPMSTNPASKLSSPASITKLLVTLAAIGIALLGTIMHSTLSLQLDPKGYRMSYMRPGYFKFDDFDTEHTRFASKYSLYLYREGGIDNQHRAILKGIPVLFIPGNAGSYKQVRPIAAEAATYFHDNLANDEDALARGVRPLDIFTVDFNEDFTAFHGQTLLDQAEYLNEAIRFILSLYMDPELNARDTHVPDPTSVVILGHSMGGVVARTMLLRPNYQENSINTILTMAAPHSQPPVSFDGTIVTVYDDINAYWRWAYSQKGASNNPLNDVTLVSIAGGSLDTVVPSDYSSVEMIVPPSHGFTVFTTGIPTVWTSMDHQSILWCDQFRKVVTKALYEVVDVKSASQTKPRAERMRVFRKWFLTGLEPDAEKQAISHEPTTLLTLGEDSTFMSSPEERLVVRNLGVSNKPRAWLLPVPTHLSSRGSRFTFMTDAHLDKPGQHGKLEVLLCNVHPVQSSHTSPTFASSIDLAGGAASGTKLACKNAAQDAILLPASTKDSQHPFYLEYDNAQPLFSYLQYDIDALSDTQFIAVVDKASSPSHNLVLAEFTDDSKSLHVKHLSLGRLAMFGMTAYLPAVRPLVSEVRIPAIYSGLLAFKAEISGPKCSKKHQQESLFAPLVRQYTTRPYESKLHVNVRRFDINFHGQSPYVLSVPGRSPDVAGLSLQLWIDPSCASQVRLDIRLDFIGSLGKMYMRYRTVFAAVPLAIVVLTLVCQFSLYNSTGVFVPFLHGLDYCVRHCMPVVLVLSLGLLLALHGDSVPASPVHDAATWQSNNGTLAPMFSSHHVGFLIGTSDLFFWYLIPMIGLVCLGVCIALHYVVLLLTHTLSALFAVVLPSASSFSSSSSSAAAATAATATTALPSDASSRWSIGIMTAAHFLLWAFLPYQFAFLLVCLAQLATTTRALRHTLETRSLASSNLHNFSHAMLLLFLWLVPINTPVTVVWLRNLMVHWLTPFSGPSNVLSISGALLLANCMRAMKPVPRVGRARARVTALLGLATAGVALVFGVSYAYVLHHLVHVLCAWLVCMYWWPGRTPAVVRDGSWMSFDGWKQGKKP
ncbi:hypothetical protein TD95_000351 [Thielaviopsis punctulata]|uniref:GPI inositol-deacylase n=1 Tax=Thielaviopsis punctulata TaxID=72032 RepID=A0A0F4Z699_9PEZI|nr:hypothetical protein TD95_000351 [Thielaviopsis punctulata]